MASITLLLRGGKIMLDSRMKAILSLVNETKYITARELAISTGVSAKTIGEKVKELNKRGYGVSCNLAQS